MIITYNPENRKILKKRAKEAEEIFNKLPYRYCFITGSFLFSEKYNDIDVFVITRSKKKVKNKNINLQFIDFNDLSSLFYHSVKKCCLAKNILPERNLKVSIKEYWEIVNETLADVKNMKKGFAKEIRSLLVYTEFLNFDILLDSFALIKKSKELDTINKVQNYVNNNVANGIVKKVNQSYIKRFFYTQASLYKGMFEYKGMKEMYALTHAIIKNGNINAV